MQRFAIKREGFKQWQDFNVGQRHLIHFLWTLCKAQVFSSKKSTFKNLETFHSSFNPWIIIFPVRNAIRQHRHPTTTPSFSCSSKKPNNYNDFRKSYFFFLPFSLFTSKSTAQQLQQRERPLEMVSGCFEEKSYILIVFLNELATLRHQINVKNVGSSSTFNAQSTVKNDNMWAHWWWPQSYCINRKNFMLLSNYYFYHKLCCAQKVASSANNLIQSREEL